MHEYALAEAVLETALEVAEKEGLSRITGLVVRIGELQTIEKEIFEFALKEVMPRSEPKLASLEVTLETMHARFRCRPCKREFTLAEAGGPRNEDESEAIHFIPELAHSYLRCPDCGSPDFQMLEGRGVTIASIEGD
jgi:hydrogenase nickel incorporation protein HypA/HybF